MCGRFFRHEVSWEEYHDALNLFAPENVEAPGSTYNAAPTTLQPVIIPRKEGGTEMLPAVWGLIPSWWKKPFSEKKFSSFNAKCETAHEKPVFRGAYRYRRCLVPMSGFYEWTGPKGAKQPFAIGLRNRRWFCCAGLWDTAMIDGSEIDSFTILTTTPNDVMAGLHTRMPVIIAPENYLRWMDIEEDPRDLFEPFSAADMHAWPVKKDVGNVRNNRPDLIEEA